MKRERLCVALPLIVLAAACSGAAQEAVAAQAGTSAQTMGFWDTLGSSTTVGLLEWMGILGWAAASLPLGILSIVHCARNRIRQLPLATKLLILGSAWVVVLGLAGFSRWAICGFAASALSEAGAAQQAMLAADLLQSFYPLLVALMVCQLNLLFLLISMVIRHRKRRDIMVGP